MKEVFSAPELPGSFEEAITGIQAELASERDRHRTWSGDGEARRGITQDIGRLEDRQELLQFAQSLGLTWAEYSSGQVKTLVDDMHRLRRQIAMEPVITPMQNQEYWDGLRAKSQRYYDRYAAELDVLRGKK